MHRFFKIAVEYGLLLIITIPSFISILNPYMFSMHDSQQVARLYVLTTALRQGILYPRWVDLFGFNYGYPLFNFYPPLIYYVGALYALFGLNVIWAVKMVFVTGFAVAAVGVYELMIELIGERNVGTRIIGYTAAVFYTYFTYHAVNMYVRGAMAEFFSMAVLPFVFLTMTRIRRAPTMHNALYLAMAFAALILTHPLIAFPSLLFISTYGIYLFATSQSRFRYLLFSVNGGLIGLALSSFYWIPSMIERKYTLVDQILLGELAKYAIHFVQPSQLWYSAWGYGGSGPGYQDGMSFQLGKIYIGMIMFAIMLGVYIWVVGRRNRKVISTSNTRHFWMYCVFMIVSIVMTLEVSKPVWQTLTYLQYMQFPWRFLTFADLFISIVAAYGIYMAWSLVPARTAKPVVLVVISGICACMVLVTYQKYFKPDHMLLDNVARLTSFDEIAWRVSRTSFEFVPRGVKTTKSDLNTTILAITPDQLSHDTYSISPQSAHVTQVKNTYIQKVFTVDSSTPATFMLHAYNFPGWTAHVDADPVGITDHNDNKLVTIPVSSGHHLVRFDFVDTPIRRVANTVSQITASIIAIYMGIYSYRRRKYQEVM